MLTYTTLRDAPATTASGAGFQCSIDPSTNTLACVGTAPVVAALFKRLQTALNGFASRLGFAALNVDGILGDKTLAALRTVTKAIVAANNTTSPPFTTGNALQSLAAGQYTISDVAAGALTIVTQLTQAIVQLATLGWTDLQDALYWLAYPPIDVPTSSTTAIPALLPLPQVAAIQASTDQVPAGASQVSATNSRKWGFIGAGIGVIAGIGVGVLLARR